MRRDTRVYQGGWQILSILLRIRMQAGRLLQQQVGIAAMEQVSQIKQGASEVGPRLNYTFLLRLRPAQSMLSIPRYHALVLGMYSAHPTRSHRWGQLCKMLASHLGITFPRCWV
jgi:hypothetical protein